jgi:hypothetical protein
MAQLRDEIITTMIGIGLDPYWNGLGLERGTFNLVDILRNNLQNGMDEVCKLKLCIADGYRFNILTKEIMSRDGLGQNANREDVSAMPEVYIRNYRKYKVSIRSSLIKTIVERQKKPNNIVSSSIGMRKGRSEYEFIADSPISVLDGFISPDLRLLWK